MKRSYMSLKITDLEALFAKPEIDDATLAKLAHELSHRGVPRAVALLEEVERMQKSRRAGKAAEAKPASDAKPAAAAQAKRLPPQPAAAREVTKPWPQQPLAFNDPPKARPDPVPAPDQKPVAPVAPRLVPSVTDRGGPPVMGRVVPTVTERAVPQAKNPTAPPVAQLQAGQSQDISPAEAYALLELTPGAPWERVEKQRRELVERSSPLALKGRDPGAQAQALATARRVNAAYAVIGSLRLSS